MLNIFFTTHTHTQYSQPRHLIIFDDKQKLSNIREPWECYTHNFGGKKARNLIWKTSLPNENKSKWTLGNGGPEVRCVHLKH